MSSPKNSTEILTDKDLDLVLKNTTFDSVTFLRLYAEWKVTKDAHTFASLRKMHEDAGYNNKNNVFGAEEEMHQIAAIVQKYQDGKNQVTTNTANATANTAAGISQADGVVKGEKLIDPTSDKIREKLNEINPDTLEQAISISETAINLIKSEETKNTLRGVHGAILLQMLREAGHNLVMQNGQITIIPKPGTDVVNLQEKLQTLVNTGRLHIDSIKIGILYSSGAFKDYVNTKKTTDAKGAILIDPKASTQDFVTYLTDLQKAGNKNPDIVSILESKSLLSGVNMQQAIKGFQDMGQVKEWQQNNQKVMQQVETQLSVAAAAQSSVGVPETRSTAKSTPAEPNTTLTGKLTQDGVTGGHVTGVVGDSTKGLIHGIGDILSLGKGDPIATLAIGGGLIYGIYKAFQKFGFLGGLGTLFGLGAMNNIDKILGRFGVGTVAEGIDKATKKAGEIADAAKDKVGEVAAPVAKEEIKKKEETTNKSKESDIQKIPSDKVRGDTRLNGIIEQSIKTQKNATMAEYLEFINTNKHFPITYFLKTSANEDISIFSTKPSLDPRITLPSNFDPLIFKDIMRLYLTGISMPRSELNTTYKQYSTSITPWEQKFSYTDTLGEAISKIYK